jgi:D-alanyl-lipoteichoic acid acyltransferase DltB (MBOAT superfamily)
MYSSLASPGFLLAALLAPLLVAALRGNVRQAAFLAVNLAFLGAVLFGPLRALSTIGFCLLGYGITRLILWQPKYGLRIGLVVFVAAFVYLRNYDFLGWILPENLLTGGFFATVGLSFVLFKVVHVMVDAHSGTLGRLDFLTYANYCLNFTVFMMGPIQRYQDYEAQWSGREQPIPATFEAHLDAILRILVGLVKAYVISAHLIPYTLRNGLDWASVSELEILGRMVVFYFYIYLNFSGYCDVAIGAAALLGLRPPENFDKPFLARNIADFWLRFHRSLTQWLTSYVFSPVYKSALTQGPLAAKPWLAASAALLVTMVISGLWHGTTLSFLFFGLLHGLYFVTFRSWEAWATRRFGKVRLAGWRKHWAAQGAGMALTFSAVSISFVFFRLDAAEAAAVLARLFGL